MLVLLVLSLSADTFDLYMQAGKEFTPLPFLP